MDGEGEARIVSDGDDGTAVTVRIPYDSESPHVAGGEETDSLLATDVSDVNSVRCRSCDHPLLARPNKAVRSNGNEGEEPIRRVLPLPTGYWDEITDYLTCYEGVSERKPNMSEK